MKRILSGRLPDRAQLWILSLLFDLDKVRTCSCFCILQYLIVAISHLYFVYKLQMEAQFW